MRYYSIIIQLSSIFILIIPIVRNIVDIHSIALDIFYVSVHDY